MERWAEIEDTPRYLISDYGRVWSTIIDRELRPGVLGKGYLGVCLMGDDGQRLMRYVHILVAENFVEGQDFGLEVNHKDTDKTNNFWTNLE